VHKKVATLHEAVAFEPSSQLETPSQTVSSQAAASTNDTSDACGEIEWVDSQVNDESLDGPLEVVSQTAATPKSATTARQIGRPDKSSTAAKPKTIPSSLPEPNSPAVAERKPRSYPPKNAMIFGGVFLLVILTFAIRARQQQLSSLPAVIQLGRSEGLSKLDLGEFQAAKQLLAEASRAVKTLGGQVEGADEILQGGREAALFADRLGEPLEFLVESASKVASPSDWNSRFETLYKGQSVIFDTTVLSTPEVSASPFYQIDYEILFGKNAEPVGRGIIDLSDFKLFERAKPKAGDKITFGARLDSMVFDSVNNVWRIRLASDSGCLITHYHALEHVGIKLDTTGETRK
jgi:hypothetical protein